MPRPVGTTPSRHPDDALPIRNQPTPKSQTSRPGPVRARVHWRCPMRGSPQMIARFGHLLSNRSSLGRRAAAVIARSTRRDPSDCIDFVSQYTHILSC
ncbi:hypothetical protein BO70DRAFT_126782 [Aspergillus heteromorphus CBS 117.55]|uniref:Uncharacterized protein n=1 Tax=Aspergillus heteromorphus CBS 117.55 TaxID=1448321 RepID=A0A317V9E0_9EURO|nr:uncharacterized protein BO70DRAFT_126782 [Aspergillus heteromorphus CBS 117.55]PWY71004.1 hypothetical protein BO70DRAFT_126782 [Aspergillus heteromorphus CBS 117.55]